MKLKLKPLYTLLVKDFTAHSILNNNHYDYATVNFPKELNDQNSTHL